MSQVFIGNVGARLAERLDDSGNLERVPYQDGVGYQAQAARFVHDLLVIPGAEFSLVGEKDPACQCDSLSLKMLCFLVLLSDPSSSRLEILD